MFTMTGAITSVASGTKRPVTNANPHSSSVSFKTVMIQDGDEIPGCRKTIVKDLDRTGLRRRLDQVKQDDDRGKEKQETEKRADYYYGDLHRVFIGSKN